MDTLIVVKELLQTPKDTDFFWGLSKKEALPLITVLATIVITLLVTGYNLWISKKREIEKDKIRVGKVRGHIFTWLGIIRTDLLLQAYECKTLPYVNNLRHSAKRFTDFTFYHFPFSEILEIDRVDLSEILLNKKEINGFILGQLYSLNRIICERRELLKKDFDETENTLYDCRKDFYEIKDDVSEIFKNVTEVKANYERLEKILFKKNNLKDDKSDYNSNDLSKEINFAFSWIDESKIAWMELHDNYQFEVTEEHVSAFSYNIKSIIFHSKKAEEKFLDHESVFLVFAAKISFILDYFNNKIVYESFEKKYRNVNSDNVRKLNSYTLIGKKLP